MSLGRRREMVDRKHPNLPIVRQCALLGVSRSSLYYRPKATSQEDLSLMRELDRQYLETPFYGSRRMKAWLERRGIAVNRKRVQRLMRAMGMRAIYRRPSTSRKAPEHRVYPYLLRNARITRPNQVWAADITYLPMARGFLYLVAVMDWYSRVVADFTELMFDSWVKAHGLSLTREHDEIGLLTTCGPAFRLSRTPVQAGHPAPKPGRHAREILEEHGLGGDYQRLVDAGVVVVDGIKAG